MGTMGFNAKNMFGMGFQEMSLGLLHVGMKTNGSKQTSRYSNFF